MILFHLNEALIDSQVKVGWHSLTFYATLLELGELECVPIVLHIEFLGVLNLSLKTCLAEEQAEVAQV